MRILHTSDWHLGRLFHGVHLTNDQAHVLSQLVQLAKDSQIDAVVVAGDVYDRQVPPPDAVALLDDTLAHFSLDLKIPVLMIAGNHDSPERLGFGSRLLAEQRLHVAGGLPNEVTPILLRDKRGPVEFFLVPYAEPAVARDVLGDESVVDHNSSFGSVIGRIKPGSRSVLVAHAFVAGGQESPDSERPLSVGGTGTVEASVFKGFNYVALGHLHRPQAVDDAALRYSGSLLKYSFAEAPHRKSVSIVDMDADGRCTVEEAVLSPLRDVRRIEGTLEEVLKNSESDLRKDDYLEVSLRGRDAMLEPLAQLRKVYRNVLSMRRPDLEQPGTLVAARLDLDRITDANLFASFFHQVSGSAMTSDEKAALQSVLESLRLREVTA